MILDRINSPEDLKILSPEELEILSGEVRDVVLFRTSKIGGHIGPNLGIVELTVALHFVFNSPKDKIVFDVSHQCYAHKILTGRKNAFMDESHLHDVTGFTAPKESIHDVFQQGHASTSIALATGLAKGRDIKGDNYNVIAVIGDGSLSGGIALEGLNNAAVMGSNIIVILNDNDMSIDVNNGGIYKNLKELRETEGKSVNNIFKAIGFDYYFIKDGNDVNECIDVLKKVKDLNHPVLVHALTLKGKGLKLAETKKNEYHSGGPFDIKTGEYLKKPTNDETYDSLTHELEKELLKRDPSTIFISAAAPFFYGNDEERKPLIKNMYDTGIAEEDEFSMAAGVSKAGGNPVVSIYSYFIQRAYDTIHQDLCMNNEHATILIFGGTVGDLEAKTTPSSTHIGIYDISLLSNIPNLVFLAPKDREEYVSMFNYATSQKEKVVVIRVPQGKTIKSGTIDNFDYSNENKFEMVHRGKKVAMIGVGNFFEHTIRLHSELLDLGIDATLINPRFISGVDTELLEDLKKDHELVLTFENGIVEGGFGSKVASFYSNSSMKVKNYGLNKQFYDFYPMDKLREENHLRDDLILSDIDKLLEDK